jgi:hypothetical protein
MLNALNFIKPVLKEDYERYNDDGKFESFFKSVFKDKLEKIRC